MGRVRFGAAIAPVGDPELGDRALYGEVVADAKLVQQLGFDAAWMLEHHFTDYFPTPSPLLFMAHVAAHCPGLGLGTAVLVTPWYQPLRLAEELAMLSNLTDGELHIGMGRGTARLEYEAYDVAMGEARERFAECWSLLRQALDGGPIDFHGRHYRVRGPVSLRPRPDAGRLHFYGAIGSPETAGLIADMDLPPLCISSFGFAEQAAILGAWSTRRQALGRPADAGKPVLACCFLADTDDEARRLAERYMCDFYRLQARHYEVDADPWRDVPGYRQFSDTFAGLKKLTEPAGLAPWLDLQFVGSAATVRRRVEQYLEAGFDMPIVQTAYVNVPRAVRHDSLRRFARDVAPAFSDRFGAAA